MRESIAFGTKQIDFVLQYKNRKTLGITVTPAMQVIVDAPEGTSLDKVKEKVRKRAPWILKQQDYFSGFQPLATPKRYVSGETHLYLGRQYRLKIIESTEEQVKLKGRYIEIQTPTQDKAQALLEKWYLEHAKLKFQAYLAPLEERFNSYGVKPSGFEIRRMPKRWGSCTPKGKIILNTELIKAPKGCIEYVIIHELCHLVHPDHSKAYWNLLDKEMPAWQKWKERLEKILA